MLFETFECVLVWARKLSSCNCLSWFDNNFHHIIGMLNQCTNNILKHASVLEHRVVKLDAVWRFGVGLLLFNVILILPISFYYFPLSISIHWTMLYRKWIQCKLSIQFVPVFQYILADTPSIKRQALCSHTTQTESSSKAINVCQSICTA